jgi:hypothetical protein
MAQVIEYINKELQMDDDIEEHNRNIYLVNTMDENNEVTDSKDNLYNKHSCDIQLTHVDSSGKAKMVDVGEKNDTHRIAIATATICLGQEAFCCCTNCYYSFHFYTSFTISFYFRSNHNTVFILIYSKIYINFGQWNVMTKWYKITGSFSSHDSCNVGYCQYVSLLYLDYK